MNKKRQVEAPISRQKQSKQLKRIDGAQFQDSIKQLSYPEQAQNVLDRQADELFMEEFLELVDGKEQIDFAKKWVQSRMIPFRDGGIDLYLNLLEQEADNNDKVPTSESDAEKIRAENINDYANYFTEMWPKYLQVALHEISQKLKCKLIHLSNEEFESMPLSWCDNILPKKDPKTGKITDQNDWQPYFQDFLREDILIETSRFFKLKKIQELCESSSEIMFVTKKFTKEVLEMVDFEQLYKGIIQKLPGKKWQSEHTDQYLELAMEDFQQIKQIYKGEIQKFREVDQSLPSKKKTELTTAQTKNMASKKSAKPQSKAQIKSKRSNSAQPAKPAENADFRQSKARPEILQSKVRSPRKKVIVEKEQNKLNEAQMNQLFDESEDEEYSEPKDLSDEDSEGNSDQYEPYVQRRHLLMFNEAHGKSMKEKKNNPNKFTKGTNPEIKDLFKFMMSENGGCPSYLPMLDEDVKVSEVTLLAAGNDPDIPISEQIRKEFFFKSYLAFHKAVQADPAIFADEIRRHWTRFDNLFGTIRDKTPEQRSQKQRFTQGDYRRFCAILYLFTRKTLMMCELMMEREKKKRVQPRHLLTALVQTGVIPLNILRAYASDDQEKALIEQMFADKKATQTQRDSA